MQRLFVPRATGNQRGAVAIMVGLSLFMFVGFAALAIDIGNLLVARNELQNAADAGALAGARKLYTPYGTVNPGANEIARAAAMANMSQNIAVEVNLGSGNDGDVQRGHYSFTNKKFTPVDALNATDLWERSASDLDLDETFVNAVQVVTRREEMPITAFFAGIFGRADFEASAEAIAYIGFAGNLQPGDIDQPIALCQQALVNDDDNYTCNIGRMINSGGNVETSNTGGWTSYSQNNPCSGGTNASEMKGLICSDGNPEPIILGEDIATSGGQIQSAFKDFYDCWVAYTNKTEPWQMTLLVIDCDKNNITTCQETTGAVMVSIMWISDQNDPNYNNVPEEMNNTPGHENWPTPADHVNYDLDNGEERWKSFVNHFNLKNIGENGLIDAPYDQKSIYFLPICEPWEPRGSTGGENFGILAAIPVLVR